MINNIKEFKTYIENEKIKKIYLICGKKSFKTSGANVILEDLLKSKEIKIYYKKSDYPILEELIEINKDLKNQKPDLMLAVGGGAVIDYAKMANILDNTENISDLIVNYNYPFKKRHTRLAVIPTTAGSGAEVTSNAVIYVNKIKYSFESDLLIPDIFFLLPEFLISAPSKVKSSAGFDAIAQALESLVSVKSNDDSVKYALQSLEISTNSFIPFIKNSNLKNASQMSMASHLAGKAINISKTTVPHATSYPFTVLFNISHGHAVSLFFEDFFKYNFDNLDKSQTSFNLKERFDLIFDILNVKDIVGFCKKISKIKTDSNIETDLKVLKIDIKNNFDKIIEGVNILRLKNNPVKINADEIYKILSRK